MWNSAVNDWALSHLEWADIMVEAKAKNLASIGLYKYSMENNNELFKSNVRKKKSNPDPIII